VTLYLGIDPGLDGALALLDTDDGGVTFWDMPTLEVGVGKSKKRRDYNVNECLELLSAFRDRVNRERPGYGVSLEKVHAMPTNGSLANFSMGGGFMLWRVALATMGLAHDMVAPETWKKALLAGKGGGKDAGRQRALELFPQAATHLSRVKDHGRADALLIAEYRRRQFP